MTLVLNLIKNKFSNIKQCINLKLLNKLYRDGQMNDGCNNIHKSSRKLIITLLNSGIQRFSRLHVIPIK